MWEVCKLSNSPPSVFLTDIHPDILTHPFEPLSRGCGTHGYCN